MTQDMRDSCLQDWSDREAVAESMLPLVGSLFRKNNVITSLYGRAIINRSVIDIMKAHRFVRHMEKQELTVHDTFPVLKALTELDVNSIHVDIGRLAVKYRKEGNGMDVKEFVAAELGDAIGQNPVDSESRDIVLYGFGRIGRLLARILIEKAGAGRGLRLRAIVVRRGKGDDLVKRASLLRRDSVHGTFRGSLTIDEENEALIANGNYIKIIYASNPAEIDYTAYGINNALVIDNTGVWRDQAGLSQHLNAKGVSRVLLTAPGKGDIKNIVYGINHSDVAAEDTILSAASCTTNAITPVLKVMHDQYNIISGHVETVHSYTNDQNLIDNYHSGDRRGRSAPLNMVITETGAAKAVAKALPALKGKLTGNAIRVPTPNVSMAILSLNLSKEVTVEEVNDYLRDVSLNTELHRQIDWVNSPEVVSTDFVGNSHAGIVDAKATIVNGSHVNLYVWYDNEYGYSRQVVRIAHQLCGVEYPMFPRA
ncbi:glyceraldehyde-3-phosphate dehydrogenase [Parathalassolituus penaei]|uniref:Glyceraldehyde-3-phosphate dehydrogenase n=1 Tax=Parathalassolituus penaei TaxID=2997323 RepID=A0A9X3ECL5_9GAMM|nr:glyceraldehyde-3-phosphate dehydrogenase [Parathalassolituus penaei]MCY0964665.1 glyceraldehyde-3-phosphate dehydrogenase [Parathalassolituus penaei]